MVKVSIVIPVYNVEKYLKQCLDSIINQTLRDIEIICVNDGSKDNSLSIIKEYAQKDNRIKIIDKQNSGYGDSVNKGFDIAAGEYVAIVEPDDYIDTNMYLELYEIANQNNVDFVKADFYRFTGEQENEKLFYNKIDSSDKYYNKIVDLENDIDPFDITISTWTGIYKREFLNQNNIRHNTTPGASFQDSGFWFQTFVCGKKAYFVSKPFYRNRRDNENSSVYDKSKVYTIAKEYDFIYNFLSKNEDYLNKYSDIYYRKRFDAYIWNYNRLSRENKKEFIKYFSSEFKSYLKDKKINFKYFSNKHKNLLKQIVKYPSFTYYMHNDSLDENSFIEQIFSLRNRYYLGDKSQKILTILGIKITIKTYKK